MKLNEKLSGLEDRPLENLDKVNRFNISNFDETIEKIHKKRAKE